LGVGCKDDPAKCAVEGEPRVSVVPAYGTGADSEGVLDLVVFDAPQGGPASEIDIELEGIAFSDIERLTLRLLDGEGEVIAESSYGPRRVGFECVNGSTLASNNTPLAYFEGEASIHDGVEGTLELELEGVAARSESWSVRVRIR